MIHCINCGHVNAEGATHCEACFEKLPAVTSCPTCQATVPDDAYFCPQCGASLPRGIANQPDAPLPSGAEAVQPPSDLPPTNVVAQQAFENAPLPPTNVVNPPAANELPPTNVVNPAIPNDLPPTNVVNSPAANELPPTNVVNPDISNELPPYAPPASSTDSPELPPTNVVNPLPETLPPQQPPNFSSDLPPTNVVNPLPPEAPSVDTPPSNPPSESEEAQDQIETVPTMVVSPSSDRNVVDTPLPVEEPTVPPFVPPTVPPQAPPTYQYPAPGGNVEEPSTNMPFPGDIPIEPNENTLAAPMTEAAEVEEVQPTPQFEDSVPSATTVQPIRPPVGETVIQRPAARLLHERTKTNIALPTNLDIILIGKMTSSITPDVDVSCFMDSDVVSRRHAAIFVTPEGYFIEDLGSSNGTYINDVPCTHGDRMPINPGDRICLGRENKVGFIFQVG